MGTPSTTLIAILAIGILFVVLPVAADVYFRFRDRRTVICPETGRAADVSLDAWHAAATALPGPPRLHVIECTRWPKRAGCAEKCVANAH